MNICIDIGNTNAKAGIFDGEHLLKVESDLSDKGMLKLIRESQADHIMISSVRRGIGRILREASRQSKLFQFDQSTPVPFINAYRTPHTLGLDRIAAICGAQYLFPMVSCLVIDIGTCITYDVIDKQGVYHGGGISPGVEMRLKAMHKFTSKLPLLAPKYSINLIGNSTATCLLSGAVIGTEAEIEGIISRYTQYFEELNIIICGGGAKFFESKIKGHIFALPNLVLIGLNRILRFNLNV